MSKAYYKYKDFENIAIACSMSEREKLLTAIFDNFTKVHNQKPGDFRLDWHGKRNVKDFYELLDRSYNKSYKYIEISVNTRRSVVYMQQHPSSNRRIISAGEAMRLISVGYINLSNLYKEV